MARLSKAKSRQCDQTKATGSPVAVTEGWSGEPVLDGALVREACRDDERSSRSDPLLPALAHETHEAEHRQLRLFVFSSST
jgi:hypothetical protein